MKSLSFFAVGCVFFPLILQPANGAEPEWKLQVDLIDGSRIVGTPVEQSLTIDVGFGELDVPLSRIRQAEWKKDRKIRIELTNRDVLTGRVVAAPGKIATLFGDVELKVEHMQALEVVPANLLGWLPSQRGLVLYYSFDREESSRIVNLADDKHHAKASGVRWLAEGRRGGAVELDGSGMIEVPNHGDICPATLTLAMWVYPTNTDTGYEMLAAKTDAGSWSNGYGFVRSSREAEQLRFFVNSYSGTAAKAKVPRNKWSHLAGTFNGRNLTIYLNGDQINEIAVPIPGRPALDPFGEGGGDEGKPDEGEAAPMAAPIRHSSNSLWIGKDKSGYTWKGKMDEFVLYGRALSAKEIARLYEAGKADE